VADHRNWFENAVDDVSPIQDEFPNESLFTISNSFPTYWFGNTVNYVVASIFHPLAFRAQTDKIKYDAKYYA